MGDREAKREEGKGKMEEWVGNGRRRGKEGKARGKGEEGREMGSEGEENRKVWGRWGGKIGVRKNFFFPNVGKKTSLSYFYLPFLLNFTTFSVQSSLPFP